MKQIHLAKCAVLFVLLASAGYGSVIYTFTGATAVGTPLPPSLEQFALTVPDFLAPSGSSSIMFECHKLDFNVNCGFGVFFSRSSLGDSIQFDDVDGAGYLYTFPQGSFGSTGIHLSNFYGDDRFNNGTLQVILRTGTPAPVPVPEPTSALLVLAGLIGAEYWRRRRPKTERRRR